MPFANVQPEFLINYFTDTLPNPFPESAAYQEKNQQTDSDFEQKTRVPISSRRVKISHVAADIEKPTTILWLVPD